MEIQKVTDASFGVYGKVLEGYDFSGLLKEMGHTPCPMDEVIYVPSVEGLEALAVAKDLTESAYGGLPIQNAVEYHRSSEVDIAVNDLILLIGRQQDIEADFTYDTAKIEAFYVPAGTAVELYATTLHYAPCSAGEDGFRCVVVLPKDTNLELNFTPGKDGEDKLITARNKWLIAHEDAKIEGAFNGLKGENITL